MFRAAKTCRWNAKQIWSGEKVPHSKDFFRMFRSKKGAGMIFTSGQENPGSIAGLTLFNLAVSESDLTLISFGPFFKTFLAWFQVIFRSCDHCSYSGRVWEKQDMKTVDAAHPLQRDSWIISRPSQQDRTATTLQSPLTQNFQRFDVASSCCARLFIISTFSGGYCNQSFSHMSPN